MSARIWIRRAYEPPSANDGYGFWSIEAELGSPGRPLRP